MDDQSPATRADLNALGLATQASLRGLGMSIDATQANLKGLEIAIHATQADVQKLERVMSESYRVITQEFRSMDERFKRAHDDVGRVLAVLAHVDVRQKREHKNHERRIVTLEKVMAA